MSANTNLRVLAMNHSDTVGGAARAAYRVHQAVRSLGVESVLQVNQKALSDQTVQGPSTVLGRLIAKLYSGMGQLLIKPFKTNPAIYQSIAVMPSRWADRLNASKQDVIHLHWVNGEMISIADIGNITKPLIWTMHDMWGIAGAEHYCEDHRARDGYSPENRPAGETGFDLNRWTWLRKVAHWKNPHLITTPSRWMAEKISESALLKGWPVMAIANPIDTEVWCPIDQAIAREQLGLPKEVPLILFGASGGATDPRKGFDLLLEALPLLKESMGSSSAKSNVGSPFELLVFGQDAPKGDTALSAMRIPTHYMGHIDQDHTLRLLYSAADVMVVPSRQESFGQTASEALACGCPVAAFGATGLLDVVGHLTSGYLAKPFEPTDLAMGIEWLIRAQQDEKSAGRLPESPLRLAARKRAVDHFSYPVIAEQYIAAYQYAIKMRS
jgi:glycosyltransferase involved in cell wall biosynthesis